MTSNQPPTIPCCPSCGVDTLECVSFGCTGKCIVECEEQNGACPNLNYAYCFPDDDTPPTKEEGKEEKGEEVEEDSEEESEGDGWSVLCYNTTEYGEAEQEQDFPNGALGKQEACVQFDQAVASGLYGTVELVHYVGGDGDHVRTWERDEEPDEDGGAVSD